MRVFTLLVLVFSGCVCTPELEVPSDAGLVDAGVVDAGVVDAGVVDAGVVDAGRNAVLDGGSDAGGVGSSDGGRCLHYFQAQPAIGAPGSDAIVTGDFDRNGRVDLVVAGANSTNLFLIDGGVFVPTGATGLRGDALRAGDFDADQQLDLLTFSGFNSEYQLARGNGDGTFRTPVRFSAATGWPRDLEVGDFNLDSRLDFAGILSSGEVTLALNGRDGGFSFVNVPLAPGAPLRKMVVRDFNRDGRLDIVTSADDGLRFNAGAPNAAFLAPVLITNVETLAVQAGDFNRDGLLDLISVNTALRPYRYEVRRGLGTGTFMAPTLLSDAPPVFILGLGVFDLNGDGTDDLVIPSMEDNWIQLYLGGPSGLTPWRRYAAGSQPAHVAFLDVDGDGQRDLVVNLAYSFGALSVLRNTGAGFEAALFAPGIDPFRALQQGASRDVNGDQRADLALVATNGLLLSVSTDAGQWDRVTFTGGADGVALGDFNRDGRVDVARSDGATVRLELGQGTGAFVVGPVMAAPTAVGQLVAADFNEDGAEDLLALEVAGSAAFAFLSTGGTALAAPTRIGLPAGAYRLTLADFDGDLHVDVALFASNALILGRGSGLGTFTFGQPVAIGFGSFLTAAGDVDGDRRPDIVLTSESGYPSVLLQRDGGFVESWFEVPSSRTVSGPAVVDLDRDGRAEIVVGMRFSNEVLAVSYESDGGFRPSTYVAGQDPRWPMVGDFDGDGRPDVVVLDSRTGSAALLLNRCP
jgi:hypothetical protein